LTAKSKIARWVVSGKGPGFFQDLRVLSVEPITELIPVLKAALR